MLGGRRRPLVTVVLALPHHTPNKERLPLFVYGSCISSDLPLTSMGTGCFPFAHGNISGDAAMSRGKGERLNFIFFFFFCERRVKKKLKSMKKKYPNSFSSAPIFVPSLLPLSPRGEDAAMRQKTTIR